MKQLIWKRKRTFKVAEWQLPSAASAEVAALGAEQGRRPMACWAPHGSAQSQGLHSGEKPGFSTAQYGELGELHLPLLPSTHTTGLLQQPCDFARGQQSQRGSILSKFNSNICSVLAHSSTQTQNQVPVPSLL